MATKEKVIVDPLTTVSPEEAPYYNGPTTEVFLPELEDSGDGGLKVDQYEHVTIANEEKEMIWRIHRGIRVPVPVPVFIVLKARYPKI